MLHSTEMASKTPTKNAQELKPRMRKVLPPQYVWPLLFTLGNLIAGFAAIHFAYKDPQWVGPWGWSGLTMAGALIIVGMLLDSVDGALARLTGTVSELGATLDSLADLVTCGVAPAVMTIALVSTYVSADGSLSLLGPDADLPWGKVVWSIAAAYLACTALRLARFNVETQPEKGPNEHITFKGMPSPGAAGLVAALIILHQHYLKNGDESLWLERAYAFGVPGVVLLCAFAMVSNIPYDHFANRYLGRPQSFRFIATFVIIIFLGLWWFQETVAVGFIIYGFSGPLSMLKSKNKEAVLDS